VLRDGGDRALLVGLLATVPGRDLDRQLSDHQIDEAPRGQSASGQPAMAGLLAATRR
jgi:hypothetical protein